MRLQKQLSRVVDNKEYPKWIIVIPPSTIEKIGWNEGELLTEEIHGKNLLIRPMEKKEIAGLLIKKESKPSYEEFKGKIRLLLHKNTNGLTWSEIKRTVGFPQKVPNNKWVRKLEKDIQLIRYRDRKRGIVWKLE